jgi:hypothetical protein
MSLVASPFGFALRKNPSGQSRASAYTIASGYGTDIGYGDFVILNTNGTIVAGAANSDTIGQFAGVRFTDATGKPCFQKNWPAGTVATNIECYVYDNPDEIYEVQVASGGSGYVQAAIGDQADLVTGTVNAATGQSAQALNATLKGAGVQGQFRIVGFGNDGVYDATLNPFPTVLVQNARHQFVSAKTAI